MAYSHEILVAAPALLVLSRVSFMIAQIEMGGMTGMGRYDSISNNIYESKLFISIFCIEKSFSNRTHET